MLLLWRNHLSVANWLLNNATLSPNDLDFVRNVRSKLERDRAWKPGPDQKKWLYALYKRERKRSRRRLGSLAPASIFSASIA